MTRTRRKRRRGHGDRPAGNADPVGPVEVELKLDVLDAAAARGLVEADTVAGLTALGPPVVINSVDRYIDTPSGGLRHAGWVARLRSTDATDDVVLAVKSTARRSSGAVHRRDELEGPALPDLPPAEWPESPARDRLLALSEGQALDTVIVLSQRRRQRRFGDGVFEVELSLDRVKTIIGERVADRSTVLEAELVSGPEERLAELGTALLARSFLVEAAASKLERAFAAEKRARLRATLPDPAKVKSAGVKADDLLSEAGRRILALQFARMLAREPAARSGRDPEDLREMRVATRRMLAAWEVFGDAFDPAATRPLRLHLRTLASALGAVRDIEMLVDSILAARSTLPTEDAEALGLIVDALRPERDVARIDLLRLLSRPTHRRWVERSVAFLSTPGVAVASTDANAPRHVRDTMPSRTWLAFERVRSYRDALPWADVPTLHALRREAKRLRYALEFIGESLGPELPELIGRIVVLQDHLGQLNDAAVAADRTRQWLVDQGADAGAPEREAIGRFLMDREREVARLRRSASRPWAALDSATFRRRLGRALANL